MSDYRGQGDGYVLLGKNAKIAQNISALQKHNLKLGRLLHKLGTEEDTPQFRKNLVKKRAQSKELCQTLYTQLRQNTGGNKAEFEKLTTQFEKEAYKWKEIAQQIEKREKEVVTQSYQDEAEVPLNSEQYRDQQAQQQDMEIKFVEYDVQEIQRRREGIMQVEQDITEVCEMVKDLKLLVDDEQQQIDDIESNITNAKAKVEGAANELTHAEKHQKSARKKNCCLLAIVLGVLVAVVLGAFLLTGNK